jgi:uncharacterized protein YqiB (DUF1249 family)
MSLICKICTRYFVMLSGKVCVSLCYIASVYADSYILPECIVRPGSFGGLMVLYEANFIKLNQLIANLGERAGYCVSRAPGDCDLYLSFEERSRYTCQLRLTYMFSGQDGERVPEPDLVAKVYRDARMVEVRSWVYTQHHEKLRELGAIYTRPLDLCWTRNIMLSKWLDYLLERGHAFPVHSLASA